MTAGGGFILYWRVGRIILLLLLLLLSRKLPLATYHFLESQTTATKEYPQNNSIIPLLQASKHLSLDSIIIEFSWVISGANTQSITLLNSSILLFIFNSPLSSIASLFVNLLKIVSSIEERCQSRQILERDGSESLRYWLLSIRIKVMTLIGASGSSTQSRHRSLGCFRRMAR